MHLLKNQLRIMATAFIFSCIFFFPLISIAATLSEDSKSAIILAYHRIGESAYSESNLKIEQFDQQLEAIKHGNYTVWPLSKLIHAHKENLDIPQRTLIITFEGAYKSAYLNAIPKLLDAKLPFTIFYAASKAEQNSDEYMNWSELKKLSASKLADIQTLPYTYDHITYADQIDIISQLNKARQEHRKNFNKEALFLSYPFGEYSNQLKDLAKQQGYEAAFTLNSGVSYAGINPFELPRFSLTEDYGDIERFQLISNAMPLPVAEVEPSDPAELSKNISLGFTLPDTLEPQAEKLSCYLTGLGKLDIQKIGSRIEIRPSSDEKDTFLEIDRMRLNCTMPETQENDGTPKWRWFGMLLHRNSAPSEEEARAH